MTALTTVTIRLLDKDYQVNCPPGERDALLQSALLLDQRMREIRKAGNVIGLERIAVMTALNLSHELLGLQARTAQDALGGDRLQRLHDKLRVALDDMEAVKD